MMEINVPSPCLHSMVPVLYYSGTNTGNSGIVPCPMKFDFKLKYENLKMVPKNVTSNSLFPVHYLF